MLQRPPRVGADICGRVLSWVGVEGWVLNEQGPKSPIAAFFYTFSLLTTRCDARHASRASHVQLLTAQPHTYSMAQFC